MQKWLQILSVCVIISLICLLEHHLPALLQRAGRQRGGGADAQMNLSSGLKLFRQAIPQPVKVLEVRKGFPAAQLLCIPAGLRIKFTPLTCLKGRAALLRLPPISFPEDWREMRPFFFFLYWQQWSKWCAPVCWHNVTGLRLSRHSTHATSHYVSFHLTFSFRPRHVVHACHHPHGRFVISPQSVSLHPFYIFILLSLVQKLRPEPRAPPLMLRIQFRIHLGRAQCFDSAHYTTASWEDVAVLWFA